MLRLLRLLATKSKYMATLKKRKGLYRRALTSDPNLIDAATNLGVIEAQGGHLPEAILLFEGAFERAPGRSAAGMNLARVFCLAGKIDNARATTARVLEFNPDMTEAKDFLKNLEAANSQCNAN
jgi:tetratricopeptide (TPR) repeat protein